MTACELDILTTEEAAALLRVVPLTLKNWRAERTGPTYWRAGRKVYYDRSAILEWVEEQRRRTPAHHPKRPRGR